MTTPAKKVPALPGPYSVDAVINRLITVAGSQEGYREGRSKSGSWNNDTAYGAWYGMNFNAWCAMFVSWSAHTAGIPETLIPKHAYTPNGYNWFKAKGQTVTTPKRGDIMYVYYSSMGRIGHIGIVESVSGGYVNTIEGNTNTSGSSQGNGTYRLRRAISSRTRFVRPDYAACVKAAPKPPAVVPGNPNPPKGPNGRPLLDASTLAAATLNDKATREGKNRPYALNTVQLAQVGLNRRTLQILLGRKKVKWLNSWSTLALVQAYQTYYLGRKGSTGIADTRTCKALAKAANYYYQD